MRFSINVPFGLRDWRVFFDILYPEYYYGVESPADYLNRKELPRLLRKNNHVVTNVVEIMDTSMMWNAALQDDFVRDDLFEHINAFIKNKNINISSFMLDLGFIPNSKNIEDDKLKLIFLKKFAFSLYKTGRFACIPVNVNSEFKLEEYSEYYFDIIQRSMFHLFKLCLNISPHDLKSSILPQDIYDKFIFDVKNIRIIYEPDTGNYLTEKLFLFWLEPLVKMNYSGEIIIVPKTKIDFIYENEIKKITTIIEKVRIKLL